MVNSKNESYHDTFFLSVFELAKQEGVRNQAKDSQRIDEHNAKYIQDVIVSVKEQLLLAAQGGNIQATVHLHGGDYTLGIASKFLRDNDISFDVYVHDHEQDLRNRRQGIILPDTRELLVYLYDNEHKHGMLKVEKWDIPEREPGALL